MAARVVVINKVLNYTIFNVRRIAKDDLLDTVAKFYHEDELFAVKTICCKHVINFLASNYATSEAPPTIAGWAKMINNKGMPIARKAGEPAQRRRHEADDLLQTLILLDVNKVELPKFLAEDLDRIPGAAMIRDTVSASQAGFASDFATQMSIFNSTMEDMLRSVECSMFDAVAKRIDGIEKKLASSSSCGSVLAPPELVPEPAELPDVQVAAAANSPSMS